MIKIIVKKIIWNFKWYDIGIVNDYKCIYVKIIFFDVISYVMVLKIKKNDMLDYFFFFRKS